jgi:hypothetical protein
MHYKRVQRHGIPGDATVRKHVTEGDTKWCALCEKLLSIDDFYVVGGKRYRRLAYCKKCDNQRQASTRKARRWACLDAMGGKCVQCGFNDYKALQIDHVNGGGCAEFRAIGSNTVTYFKKVLASPDEYQLLCANCNWIKKYDNDEVKRAC